MTLAPWITTSPRSPVGTSVPCGAMTPTVWPGSATPTVPSLRDQVRVDRRHRGEVRRPQLLDRGQERLRLEPSLDRELATDRDRRQEAHADRIGVEQRQHQEAVVGL